MRTIKECLSLILIILGIISLSLFDYALFGFSGDNQSPATIDSVVMPSGLVLHILEDGESNE
jgi:hypothetical protein